jgi:hypothetical protein
MKYPAIISIIYQREKVQYFNNKNAITLVSAKKGAKGRLGTNYIQ